MKAMQKNEMNTVYSRKDFLRTACSTSVFATLGITLTGCEVTSEKGGNDEPVIPEEAITINGNSIILNLDKEGIDVLNEEGRWFFILEALTLVVNVDGERIRAFTSVCTHQGCATEWSFISGNARCNCHLSQFNNRGEPVFGVATVPLPEYQVTRNGNIVTITKN
ncbi:MAG: Rieske (2Fe-2S) protein [Rhodothermaceae bacterium]|nr:Rieske (2Fe-2S) protein [Rhodothermaceae bacterium]